MLYSHASRSCWRWWWCISHWWQCSAAAAIVSMSVYLCWTWSWRWAVEGIDDDTAYSLLWSDRSTNDGWCWWWYDAMNADDICCYWVPRCGKRRKVFCYTILICSPLITWPEAWIPWSIRNWTFRCQNSMTATDTELELSVQPIPDAGIIAVDIIQMQGQEMHSVKWLSCLSDW